MCIEYSLLCLVIVAKELVATGTLAKELVVEVYWLRS